MAGIVHAVTLLLIMLLFGKYAEMIPMAALAVILSRSPHNVRLPDVHTDIPGAESDVTVLPRHILPHRSHRPHRGDRSRRVLASVLFIRRMAEVAEVGSVTEEPAGDDEEIADPHNPRRAPGAERRRRHEIAGSLFFGAVDKFKATLEQVSGHPKVLILRMRMIHSIDAAGIKMIRDLLARCRKQKTQLILSWRARAAVVALTRAGLIKELGEENALGNIDAALNRAREILGLPPRGEHRK